MSTVWAELQQSHLQMNPACRVSDTSTNWSTKVICFLWERFFLLWKSRNEVVFGDTPAESRQSSITKVLVELRQLHAKRDQYRPCDVSFLMSTEAAQDDQIFAETIRRQGVYRVQDWLETWKPFFRHSLTRAQAATRNFSTRRISEHFPVLHRPRFRPRARPPEPAPARLRVLPSPSSRTIDENFGLPFSVNDPARPRSSSLSTPSSVPTLGLSSSVAKASSYDRGSNLCPLRGWR
jgi:hypothetical protein